MRCERCIVGRSAMPLHGVHNPAGPPASSGDSTMTTNRNNERQEGQNRGNNQRQEGGNRGSTPERQGIMRQGGDKGSQSGRGSMDQCSSPGKVKENQHR